MADHMCLREDILRKREMRVRRRTLETIPKEREGNEEAEES